MPYAGRIVGGEYLESELLKEVVTIYCSLPSAVKADVDGEMHDAPHGGSDGGLDDGVFLVGASRSPWLLLILLVISLV